MDSAVAILNEAKSLGFYDKPLPESERDRTYAAEELVHEAQTAYDKGARGDAVTRILAIASSVVPTVRSEINERPPEEPLNGDGHAVQTLQNQGQHTGLQGVTQAKELAIARIKKERLPVPSAIEGEPPVLPRDMSQLADKSLRRLHSEFNAVLAYSNWLVAMDEADELAARQIVDHYTALAISRADKIDPATNKPKSVAILEAEAYSDPNVKEWRLNQSRFFVNIKLLKSLRDTYLSNVERISREYTMREGERNGSG